MTPSEAGRIIKALKIQTVVKHPDETSTLRFFDSEDTIRTKPYWQDQYYRGNPHHCGWYVMLEDGSEWWSPTNPLPTTATPTVKHSVPQPDPLSRPADAFKLGGPETRLNMHRDTLSNMIKSAELLPQSRELSLYRTKLEEAQMWLLKYKED